MLSFLLIKLSFLRPKYNNFSAPHPIVHRYYLALEEGPMANWLYRDLNGGAQHTRLHCLFCL